ncbi:hypothetical protein DQ393_29965 [Rhizobium tropici]|uniref:Uncharacterized protein n=1 Tax=Rhizobium tropici TaxID=398 RepID=A0A329Y261_RHITR|nr:hypothetical protein DQ393_29965 [Rhizobium tropici]
MSALATIRHGDQPRSERLIRLQDQIGAGEVHLFGFSFETMWSMSYSVACCRDSAFSRRAITTGSFMKSVRGPGLRPRGV